MHKVICHRCGNRTHVPLHYGLQERCEELRARSWHQAGDNWYCYDCPIPEEPPTLTEGRTLKN